MHRVSLFRSSGFRLSLAFTALFLIAAAVAGVAAYFVIRAELQMRHERAVVEQLDFFEASFREGGIADLKGSIDAYAKVARKQDRIFLLLSKTGVRLAGNLDRWPSGQVEHQIDAAQLGLDDDFVFFIGQRQIDGYQLLVGASAEDISELEEIFLEGVLWAALILFSIAIAGGIALTRRMNQRVTLIQASLERVTDGHFGQRIAYSGKGDDIDTLSEMINMMLDKLGASVEGMRQISNDISHDLKTPLNRLSMTIEEAVEKQALGQPVKTELEEATRETKRLITTFDALLRIAQIESGVRKSRFTEVDLVEIVRNVADFYNVSLEDSNMTLSVNLPEQAAVWGDRELLTQLFANLFENALKHTGEGTSVVCGVIVRQGKVEASISDSGVGIPMQERKNVLRRLYRLESSRTTPGSGLGLSMVKAIADLHEAALILEDNHPGLRVLIKFAQLQEK